MRALVTGCGGFIGSHLTESLLHDGHDGRGSASSTTTTPVPRSSEACTRRGSGSRSSSSRSTSAGAAWTTSWTSATSCSTSPPSPASGAAGASLRDLPAQQRAGHPAPAEAAKQWPSKRFVYASSSSVYGQAERLPTTNPSSPGRSPRWLHEARGGAALPALPRQLRGPGGALRYFSVYGPRQRPDMAFSIFCRGILLDEPVQVFGDGAQTRDFTFVGDVVAATRSAVWRPSPGVCSTSAAARRSAWTRPSGSSRRSPASR